MRARRDAKNTVARDTGRLAPAEEDTTTKRNTVSRPLLAAGRTERWLSDSGQARMIERGVATESASYARFSPVTHVVLGVK